MADEAQAAPVETPSLLTEESAEVAAPVTQDTKSTPAAETPPAEPNDDNE